MRLIPHNNEQGWTPYAWTVYVLFFTITPLLMREPRPIDWLYTLGGTAVFLPLYFRGQWLYGRKIIPIIVALALLGIALLPLYSTAGVFFIYAGSFAARLKNDRAAAAVLVGLVVILTTETWWVHANLFNYGWVAAFTVLVGAINMHFARVGRANAKLRLAHDEIEHLAKVAERERIARDLHDLLGHTLSLIILKSELATKLADRDPERARDEIRDVERISRDALAQVRAAVRGYRAGGLHEELANAREALRAAGVVLEVELAPVQLPPAHEAVIALAVREAVTNIVRHANAKRCRISIEVRDGACVTTIRDDGRGGEAPFGNGLSGMRERIEAQGGTLSRDGSNGTTVTITFVGQAILPVGEQAGLPVLHQSA
jgi:two-component system, NarL family, sensor histidine kinase DesK